MTQRTRYTKADEYQIWMETAPIRGSGASRKPAAMGRRLAHWLRRVADRVDHAGAPKGIGWSFTFEQHRGIVFRDDGKGCPLWYLGDADYDRAHAEADHHG